MNEREFDRVDRIHVGAIGDPGERVFYLQARIDRELITLTIEKGQAVELGQGSHQLLLELDRQSAIQVAVERGIPETDQIEPDQAEWRVSSIGLGYEQTTDRFLIECHELLLSDDEQDEDEEILVGGSIIRFWLTAEQLATLGIEALSVASQGRPICPLCRGPIDVDGHECPGVNGHKDTYEI